MTGTKKKLLILLLILLLLMCAALHILSNGSPPLQGLWLSVRPTDDLLAVHIAEPDGRELTLTRGESGWVADGAAAGEDKMAPLLAALGYMKAIYKLEDAGHDLGQYGLLKPRITVEVLYRDETGDQYLLGDESAGRGVYMTRRGDKAVYLIDDARAKVLTAAMETFMDVPLDQVNFNKIIGVSILSPGNGEISLNRSESPRAEGNFYWTMTKPYACTALTKAVEELIRAASQWTGVVKAPGGVPDDAYGLYDPPARQIVFYDAFDRELKIQAGNEENGRVYCRLNNLDGVYLLDADWLRLFCITPDSLVDPVLYYFEVPTVTDFVLEWDGQTHHLRAQWVETAGQDQKVQRFYLNERPVTSADYHALARMIQASLADGAFAGLPELGQQVGFISARRLSAPHEQAIAFYEWPGHPEYAGVAYDGVPVSYIKKALLEELVNKLGDFSG